MQTKNNKLQKVLPFILLATITFGIGAYLNYDKQAAQVPAAAEQLNMTMFKQPREINDFVLSEYQHPNFTKQALKNQWTMMFFGFTECPHMCPTTLAELNKMYHFLTKQNLKTLPQIVLVSVDPERDSSQLVYEYAQGFNPNFIGVRAEKPQIDELTRALGIAYFKTQAKNKADSKAYSINHSGAITLFNPQGQVAGFFNYPHDAKSIAEDFAKIQAQS